VSDKFWDKLTQTLDLGELDTPENKARAGRLNNRKKIDHALNELFATQNKKYWLEKLRAARIPSAPVNNFNEAFEDPQVKARNMIVHVEHPEGQLVRMAGNPIKLSETYADTFTPAPLLGQHNTEIFGDLLGKSEAELTELKDSSVI